MKDTDEHERQLRRRIRALETEELARLREWCADSPELLEVVDRAIAPAVNYSRKVRSNG